MMQSDPHLQDRFIHELVTALKDFDIQGICLAGSAASDELIWAQDNSGWRLMSDVEVGVVAASLKKRRTFKHKAKAIGDRYGYDVEVFLITPRRLRRGSPKNLSFRPHSPNVLMYDLIEGAKWLWKKSAFECRHFSPEQLPPWEGIRLILNRMGEGAPFLLPWFSGHHVDDEQELKRWVLKLLMAIGDANLIAEKTYTTGYLKRLVQWQKTASGLQHIGATTKETIASAYLTRRNGGFQLDDYSPPEIREAAISSIKYLLDLHCGALPPSTSSAAMRSLDEWCMFFKKHPIPVRYQAPVRYLDGMYDSLFTLPAIIKAHLTRLPIEALKNGVPIQIIGYGIIASALIPDEENTNNHLRHHLQNYFQSSDSAVVLGRQLRNIWDATCK